MCHRHIFFTLRGCGLQGKAEDGGRSWGTAGPHRAKKGRGAETCAAAACIVPSTGSPCPPAPRGSAARTNHSHFPAGGRKTTRCPQARPVIPRGPGQRAARHREGFGLFVLACLRGFPPAGGRGEGLMPGRGKRGEGHARSEGWRERGEGYTFRPNRRMALPLMTRSRSASDRSRPFMNSTPSLIQL